MAAIAEELGVSRSSVSLWVRGVTPEAPMRRHAPGPRRPNRLQRAKAERLAAVHADALEAIGRLSPRDLLIAGLALYAGEGTKRDGDLTFANSDPRLVRLWCLFLRRFVQPDERRLRARLYLHQDCDLAASIRFWAAVAAIPPEQFTKPYRAVADPSIRDRRHEHGCLHVRYASTEAHRYVLGLIDALLSSPEPIRGSSTGRAADC